MEEEGNRTQFLYGVFHVHRKSPESPSTCMIQPSLKKCLHHSTFLHLPLPLLMTDLQVVSATMAAEAEADGEAGGTMDPVWYVLSEFLIRM